MPGSDKQRRRWKTKGFRFKKGNTHNAKKEREAPGVQLADGKFDNISGVEVRLEDSSADYWVDLEPAPALDLHLLPCGRPHTRSLARNRRNEMRLIHQIKANDMWNEATDQHDFTAQGCPKRVLEQDVEIRRGVVVKQSLKCKNCDYRQTNIHKLYDEVDPPVKRRGPKAAAPNVALQVALLETAIGNTKLRTLLSSMDLPAPDRKCMDNTAERVSREIEKVAEAGMHEKLAQVTEDNNELKCSCDTRYDQCRPSCSRRTGETQTKQAVTFTTELNSTEKFIVGAFVQNKRCKKCEMNKCLGIDDEHCRANTPRFDPVSEKRAGEEIGRHLVDEGIKLTSCTTDGDACFRAGVQSVTPNPVERQNDTIHLGQTQVNRGKQKDWSDRLFPEASTKAVKDKCKKALAIDIKNRSMAILNALHNKHKNEKEEEKMIKIKADARLSVDAAVNCYQGRCNLCSKESSACDGGDVKDWTNGSIILQENRIGHLNITDNDEKLMREIMCMVLSDEGIEKTKYLSNTQLNEALNRSLSSFLPKNVTVTRTLKGRVARCIEKHNFGPGMATYRIYRKLGLAASPGQLKYLRQQQRQHWLQRMYNRALSTKIRRQRRDAATRCQKKAWKTDAVSDYRKGHADDTSDHTYQVKNKQTHL